MATRVRTENQLNRINQQLEAIFSRIDVLDPTQFNIKPNESSWSVIQVLNHLYESEILTLKYLEYKEKEGNNFTRESFYTRMKLNFYSIALALPIRYKAPKVLSSPSNEDSFEEIQDKFATLRQSFRDFILRQNEDFFRLGSCKHVVVGRLKLLNMIRFFHMHSAHHDKQILRILISIGNS